MLFRMSGRRDPALGLWPPTCPAPRCSDPRRWHRTDSLATQTEYRGWATGEPGHACATASCTVSRRDDNLCEERGQLKDSRKRRPSVCSDLSSVMPPGVLPPWPLPSPLSSSSDSPPSHRATPKGPVPHHSTWGQFCPSLKGNNIPIWPLRPYLDSSPLAAPCPLHPSRLT